LASIFATVTIIRAHQGVEIPNPYQAPQSLSPSIASTNEAPTSEVDTGEPRRQPWGVYLVAAWMLLSAFFLARLVMSMSDGQSDILGPVDPPLPQQIMFLMRAKDVAVIVLLIGGAIGLCSGNRWCWWLTGFYLMQETVMMGLAVVRFGIELKWPLPYFLIVRLLTHVIILAYLLKPNVREHFRSANITPIYACVSLLVGVVIAQATWCGLLLMA
jgi:hypothetical protein